MDQNQSEIRKRLKVLRHQIDEIQKFNEFSYEVSIGITNNFYEYIDQILLELDQLSTNQERKYLEDIYDLE